MGNPEKKSVSYKRRTVAKEHSRIWSWWDRAQRTTSHSSMPNLLLPYLSPGIIPYLTPRGQPGTKQRPHSGTGEWDSFCTPQCKWRDSMLFFRETLFNMLLIKKKKNVEARGEESALHMANSRLHMLILHNTYDPLTWSVPWKSQEYALGTARCGPKTKFSWEKVLKVMNNWFWDWYRRVSQCLWEMREASIKSYNKIYNCQTSHCGCFMEELLIGPWPK